MALLKLVNQYSYKIRHAAPRRRSHRVLLASALVMYLLWVLHGRHGLIHRHPQHHAPWVSPGDKLVVHGKLTDVLPHFVDPPLPFPDSPMVPLPQIGAVEQPWLAAVISAAGETEKRMLIRSTWMEMYGDVPFDGRFVVSNPGPKLMDVVIKENRTFGDMIVLDHLQEDDVTANTIKSLEFFKWLTTKSPTRYQFVSKMDTDLWLNARGFWDRFLAPHLRQDLDGSWQSTISRTVIGELRYEPRWDLSFPHGAMYTCTWDMVELLTSLQDHFNVVTGEDMAVGSLLLHGKERVNFKVMKGSEKFDYTNGDSRGDGTAWSRLATHPDAPSHAMIDDQALVVHRLKTKEDYLRVAECFDATGVKPRPPAPGPDRVPLLTQIEDLAIAVGIPLTIYKSMWDRIPNYICDRERGFLDCDGIWRTL